jgi:hypothetical protein
MRNKLVILITLALAVTTLTVFRLAGSHAQSPSPRDNFTFEGLAQRAIADGQNAVELVTTIHEIPVASLDDALSKYSVIVVQPNYIQHFRSGDLSITTWNKLKVTETLSQKPYIAPCSSCASPPTSAPSGFPAPAADEILTPEAGGTIVVNGVTFEQSTDLPFFTTGKKYVLFVNLNSANRIATVVGGGFEVAANNDTLIPLDTSDDPSPIVTGVASRFGNSLAQLRAAF